MFFLVEFNFSKYIFIFGGNNPCILSSMVLDIQTKTKKLLFLTYFILSIKMWQEARKQEKKLRGIMIDYKKRAERRQAYYTKMVSEYWKRHLDLSFVSVEFPNLSNKCEKHDISSWFRWFIWCCNIFLFIVWSLYC